MEGREGKRGRGGREEREGERRGRGRRGRGEGGRECVSVYFVALSVITWLVFVQLRTKCSYDVVGF